MAVVDRDANPMRFRWRLHNPFLPFERVQVPFFHDRPLPLKWTAKLRPTRSIEQWGILFSLCCSDEEGGDGFAVVADRMDIKIKTTREETDVSPENGHVFDANNNYTFVARELFIPAQSVFIEVEAVVRFQELHCKKMYLELVSKDLEKLINESSYSEFQLGSEDLATIAHVHACILRARWPSLFKQLPPNAAEGGIVSTGLSVNVFRYILIYMYTGGDRKFDKKYVKNDEFISELCRAIEMYGLGRIERVVFNRPPAFHQYETMSSTSSLQFRFLLAYGNNTFTRAYSEASVFLALSIRFSLNHPYPHFQSEIQFRHEGRLFVRVICKYLEEATKVILYECDRVVLSDQNLMLDAIFFSGLSPEMNVFLDKCRRGESLEDVERTLELHVLINRGRQLYMYESLESSGPPERSHDLKNLSDDIWRLLYTPTPTDDLKVLCGDGIYRLHKVIIAARVPNWREVLTPIDDGGNPVPAEGLVPGRLRCHLSTDAFLHILNYIYSGKVFPCSERYYDEVFDFAFASEMYYLAAIWLIWDRED